MSGIAPGSISLQGPTVPKPLAWIVTWGPLGSDPGGSARYSQRAAARGFAMMRRAAGYIVTVQAVIFV